MYDGQGPVSTGIAAVTADTDIRQVATRSFKPQTIGRLVSGSYWVPPDVRVDRIADELRQRDDVQALAVVDGEHEVVGIVNRQEFFATMVRAFAREVLGKRTIAEVMAPTRTIEATANVFSVADQLSEESHDSLGRHYVVIDSDRRYVGTFSTQDLLLHLSQMTQDDIEMARQLQTRIVRERGLVVGKSFEMFASSQAAKGVGGDFYDMQSYAPDRWVFALCDVSGKGVAASIVTAILWGMMDAYDFRRGLSQFIRQANSRIVATFESERFVTGVFLEYDEKTRTLRLCDMGHAHVYLYRKGSKHARRIVTPRTNLPIGIMDPVQPRFVRLQPTEGDTLFVTTDGLFEQENARGEAFPIDTALARITEGDERAVEEIADGIIRDFNRYRAKQHLGDDVTFAIFRFADQEVTL